MEKQKAALRKGSYCAIYVEMGIQKFHGSDIIGEFCDTT
jgi:hypothetical protein